MKSKSPQSKKNPPEMPIDSIRVQWSSHTKYLSLIRSMIEAACTGHGFTAEDMSCLVFAVDEACTNAIRHAYGMKQGQPIHLEVHVYEDRAEFSIRDFGDNVDPTKMKRQKDNLMEPGGLGCPAMEKIMDEVEFQFPEDGGTHIRMTKFFPDSN